MRRILERTLLGSLRFEGGGEALSGRAEGIEREKLAVQIAVDSGMGLFWGMFLPAKYGMNVGEVRHRRSISL